MVVHEPGLCTVFFFVRLFYVHQCLSMLIYLSHLVSFCFPQFHAKFRLRQVVLVTCSYLQYAVPRMLHEGPSVALKQDIARHPASP